MRIRYSKEIEFFFKKNFFSQSYLLRRRLERAIKKKETYSGCTVHFVNSKIDDGKIILQKKVKKLLIKNVN